MTIRETLLAEIRKNQPAGRDLPVVPMFHAANPVGLKETFATSLKQMAGDTVMEYPRDLQQFLSARFPQAKVFCSAVPEFKGTCVPTDFAKLEDAAKIDVAVVRSPLGVAETGSVLLSEKELQVNPIGFLCHDIVVLLDPNDIVENIHDAYAHPYFKEMGYSVLMSGPSGSGDINAVTVHPAQASMTLTVIFAPRPSREKTSA